MNLSLLIFREYPSASNVFPGGAYGLSVGKRRCEQEWWERTFSSAAGPCVFSPSTKHSALPCSNLAARWSRSSRQPHKGPATACPHLLSITAWDVPASCQQGPAPWCFLCSTIIPAGLQSWLASSLQEGSEECFLFEDTLGPMMDPWEWHWKTCWFLVGSHYPVEDPRVYGVIRSCHNIRGMKIKGELAHIPEVYLQLGDVF